MAKELSLNLASVDNIFSSQEERDDQNRERVLELQLKQIDDFKNHPFKVKLDFDMQEMIQSVKEYGVLVPCIVRPKDKDAYEMISGHRRKKACELREVSLIVIIGLAILSTILIFIHILLVFVFILSLL
jgi:ParB family chromosome partitioning protein